MNDLIAQAFRDAMAQVQEAMAQTAKRAAEAAESAQAFHDQLWASIETEWRNHWYVAPQDAWWER